MSFTITVYKVSNKAFNIFFFFWGDATIRIIELILTWEKYCDPEDCLGIGCFESESSPSWKSRLLNNIDPRKQVRDLRRSPRRYRGRRRSFWDFRMGAEGKTGPSRGVSTSNFQNKQTEISLHHYMRDLLSVHDTYSSWVLLLVDSLCSPILLRWLLTPKLAPLD